MLTRIDDLLKSAMSFGASDLHLRAGTTPVIRINGELQPMPGAAKLNQEETLEMAFSMMSNRQKQHFNGRNSTSRTFLRSISVMGYRVSADSGSTFFSSEIRSASSRA
jgi:Tfp pilus assembly pilus retraction ATPase PilT